jgi:predicted metalloprotease with PDZ domain
LKGFEPERSGQWAGAGPEENHKSFKMKERLMIKQFFMKRFKVAVGACLALLGGLLIFALRDSRASEQSGGKGWLGVSVQEMTPSLREAMKTGNHTGLLVTNVAAGSPADDAGIREQDVIIEFVGRKVEKSEDLTKFVRQTEPEKKVKIVVLREGERKEFEATIGKYRSRSSTPHRSFSWSGDPPEGMMFSSRPRLGVQAHELGNDLAPYFKVEPKSGALILEVTKDSPAEKAGLRAGDIITKAGEEFVRDPDDLIDALSNYEEGDKVKITYVRQGKSAAVDVELAQEESTGFHYFTPERGRLRWHRGDGWDDAELIIPDIPQPPEIRTHDFLRKALEEKIQIGTHTI